MTAFEENEISKSAQGGTELTKRSLAMLIPEKLKKEFQVIASRVREIEKDKIRIYWIHDLPEDSEISHIKSKVSRDRFHKIIFNCHQHFNDCQVKLDLPFDNKFKVIETPVEPITWFPKNKDEIRLIYFSTPQRGLDLLLPVFDNLSKKYDNIYLDVFSSWKIYGWEKQDEQCESVYEQIRQHPKMVYHGYAPKEKVVEALQKAHIFAYPCTWRETACRCLIEAMSAGLLCVHPSLGALSDTSGQLTVQYMYNSNHNEHMKKFSQYLEHAISIVQKEETQNYLSGFVKTYADHRFELTHIAKLWEMLMEQLFEQYPTAESRKVLDQQMFMYRT